MPDHLSYDFKLDHDTILEALGLVTTSIARENRLKLMGPQLLLMLLCTIGGGYITVFAIEALGRTPELHPWLPLIGAFAAFALFQLWLGMNMGFFAIATEKKRFNRGQQRVRLDARGIVLRNDVAEWRTAWDAVSDVISGKQAVVFLISGTAIAIPLAEINDLDALRAHIARWTGDRL